MTRPPLPGRRVTRLTRSFPVTTRHAVSLYPFQVGTPLPPDGPVIGLDLLTGQTAFHYDPWLLYGRRLLTSPNMVVLGQLGKGKSSLVKTHLHRQLLHGRQVFVLDPKGEYGPLAQLHGLPHLRLGPGSPDRLNPLDPHPGDSPAETRRRRVETVTALAATGLHRDPTPEERAALAAVITDLPDTALLGHLVLDLLSPPADLARRLATTPDVLAAAVRPAALELRRLLDGDLAGMLDAPSSHHLDPDGPGLVLDLSAVFGTTALPAVMVSAGAWLARTLTQPSHPSHPSHPEHPDHADHADGTPGPPDTRRGGRRPHNRSDIDVGVDDAGRAGAGGSRKRLLLVDEAWAVLHLPATTAWLQSLSKLARAHGVQLITVVHRASDLTGQADAGTATQARARGLLSDAETRVLYAQAPGELELLTDLLDLTDVEADLLTRLPPHRALWQIGQHRAVVEHHLSRLEQTHLIDTDQHMRPHHPARSTTSNRTRTGTRASTGPSTVASVPPAARPAPPVPAPIEPTDLRRGALPEGTGTRPTTGTPTGPAVPS